MFYSFCWMTSVEPQLKILTWGLGVARSRDCVHSAFLYPESRYFLIHMFLDPGPEKTWNCPTSCTFVGVNPAPPFLIISKKPEAFSDSWPMKLLGWWDPGTFQWIVTMSSNNERFFLFKKIPSMTWRFDVFWVPFYDMFYGPCFFLIPIYDKTPWTLKSLCLYCRHTVGHAQVEELPFPKSFGGFFHTLLLFILVLFCS